MRGIRAFLVLSAIASGLVATPAALADPPLTLLGKEPEARTVTLVRTESKELRGALSVPVHSAVAGTPVVSFLPAGSVAGAQAGSVSLGKDGATELKKGQNASIQLVFTLPVTASPQDLKGVVSLKVKAGSAPAKGQPTSLEVSAAGAAVAEVSLQPEQLKIQVEDATPFGNPDHTSAGVQFSGPGVPSLFEDEAKPPTFNLLLRSDHGDEVSAKLSGLTKTSSTSASGTIEIDGDLGVGKYEGSAPISSLSTNSPKLTVAIESGTSFLYVVIVVSLGTIAGGALYLASGRRRRKVLLRDQVKSLLFLYEKKLGELKEGHPPNSRTGESNLPVKPLDQYLGPRVDWYKIKWNAILEFDGAAQAIWSAIHWARSEEDLDEAGKQVDKLRERVIDWLTIANSLDALEQAAKLQPERPSLKWNDLKVVRDTNYLLQVARDIEPADEAAAKSLADRIDRQAHWHTVLARAWHARRVLKKAFEDDPNNRVYSKNDHEALDKVKLKALDIAASPESERTPEKQIEREQELIGMMRIVARTYKGDPENLALDEATLTSEQDDSEQALAILGAGAMRTTVDWDMVAPAITEAERGDRKDEFEARLERAPNVAGYTVLRDAAWTAAIAIASSAAYAVTVYNGTWGTLPDYVGAFTAGFLGKTAVNWAAMPLFQSLRTATASTPTATDAKAPSEEPTETTATGKEAGAAAAA